MNSSLHISHALADLRRPHPFQHDPFFELYAPHEAAQELAHALKGGRRANPSGAGRAIRAAYKVRVRLEALMSAAGELIPNVDPGPSVSSEPLSALPAMVADAARDTREIARLLRFTTGAITFASNRAEASVMVQLLHGKLERILSVHLGRAISPASMSVEEMIAAAGAGNVQLFKRSGNLSGN